ncbi:unnamed protein product [Acanthoscelides obtectus]|nr:unnamed protein product [Acanthoscelides obtectus]CAK1630957.1 hypothetical protein AOBTE_LOCUS6672 [Acanthoscelides obtectus]
MSHLHTFSKVIWYSILNTFVTLTLTLWISLKILRKYRIREPRLSVFTCFLGVISGFINQGVELRLRSLTARLLQLNATVLGVMLYISMNAVLFSKLSQQDESLPFKTIEEIIYERQKSICVRNDSFALENIKDQWENQFGKQEDVINRNCPDVRNPDNANKAVCEYGMVVLESKQMMHSLLKKKIVHCKVSNADRRYFITGNVYIAHKQFKEFGLIENFIKTLRSTGIIKKLERKWLEINYVNTGGITRSDLGQVDFRHVRGNQYQVSRRSTQHGKTWQRVYDTKKFGELCTRCMPDDLSSRLSLWWLPSFPKV